MNAKAQQAIGKRPTMPFWHCDWLSLTVKQSDPTMQKGIVGAFMHILNNIAKSTPRWQAVSGRHGYQQCMQMRDWPGVRISWEGTAEQGVHVTVSGTAMQQLDEVLRDLRGGTAGFTSLGTLLTTAQEAKAGWHCTRLDIACDNDYLSTTALLFQRHSGGLVTRIQRVDARNGNRDGYGTVYMGNRESGVFVRVYDKAGEQAHGDEQVRKMLSPWHRLEFEYHNERAQRLVTAYIQEGRQGVMREANSVLSFRVAGVDSNPTRCPLQPWWATLLGERADPVPRPKKTPREEDLDVRMAWVARSAGRTLAEYMEVYGVDALHEQVVSIATAAVVRLRATLPDTDPL